MENLCDRYNTYVKNAKEHIRRELQAAGKSEGCIKEAQNRFDNERLTEKQIIDIYLNK